MNDISSHVDCCLSDVIVHDGQYLASVGSGSFVILMGDKQADAFDVASKIFGISRQNQKHR